MSSEHRSLDAPTVEHLQSWVGKTETLHDEITRAPIRGFSVTLDRDDPLPQAGTPVPPLGHWFYFLPQHLQREIGPDGHAQRGGFLPPVPLPRRMWAGGRLSWLANNPLRVGQDVKRTSTIQSVTHKSGRTGDLLFVGVQHQIENPHGLTMTEEHDIVYRAAAQPGDPVPAPTAAETGAAWQRDITPDDVLLFRYSALTFNGHRIHYDLDYAKHEEHYPGLIVHGPLQTTLMLDLCSRQSKKRITKLDYRARLPLFHGEVFSVNGNPHAGGASAELWTANATGSITMSGTAWFE